MRRREYQLHFFLSEDEMVRLEELCARSKRSKSQVVRDLIRTGRVLEAPGPELHEFAVQMRSIGVSLNQIAARGPTVWESSMRTTTRCRPNNGPDSGGNSIHDS